MIGPAEIEEMRLEREEALAALRATDAVRWPAFVIAEHLEGADRALIGSYAAWIESHADG